MNLAAVIEIIPIETDKDGVIRVGNTGVTLETHVSAMRMSWWIFHSKRSA